MPTDPGDIISYWIGSPELDITGQKAAQKKWYASSADIDAEIRERFAATLSLAESGELDSWLDSAEGCLALVILLDQFSRNLYRGTAAAFMNDSRAQAVALHAMERGFFETHNIPGKVMLYHPLLHAEDQALQDRSVEITEQLLVSCPSEWRESIENNHRYAREHRETIRKFGRFPHRNKLLGRTSTPEEEKFLAEDARTYGQ